MPRYVLVNRRAGKFTDEQKHASRAAVAETVARLHKKVSIVADEDPEDKLARRVVVLDADAATIASIERSLHPDVILEPIVRRHLHARKAIDTKPSLSRAELTVNRASSSKYQVKITAGGAPLPNIPVTFYVHTSSGSKRAYTRSTDELGLVGLTLRPNHFVNFVQPAPYSAFWVMLAKKPLSGSTIKCLPIKAATAGGGGWWHEVMGIDLQEHRRGLGIRVGVIDTGCGPHPNLSHVKRIGAFIQGTIIPGATDDVSDHGTHTTGIIGARPRHPGEYAGMATGCSLFHARIFENENDEEAPTQGDIVHAIDALSRDNRCDLINMSLASKHPSQAEEDAIRDAEERGTLCICAAGDDAGPIEFPASYRGCAAVSAIGKVGWAPAGTFSADNKTSRPPKMGKHHLFLAGFSCFGPTLICAAPGVGIVSTVPAREGLRAPYMEMDGTSMASPAACGALAVILSADPEYISMARDSSRTDRARTLLAQHCVSIGLHANMEGRGIPQV